MSSPPQQIRLGTSRLSSSGTSTSDRKVWTLDRAEPRRGTDSAQTKTAGWSRLPLPEGSRAPLSGAAGAGWVAIRARAATSGRSIIRTGNRSFECKRSNCRSRSSRGRTRQEGRHSRRRSDCSSHSRHRQDPLDRDPGGTDSRSDSRARSPQAEQECPPRQPSTSLSSSRQPPLRATSKVLCDAGDWRHYQAPGMDCHVLGAAIESHFMKLGCSSGLEAGKYHASGGWLARLHRPGLALFVESEAEHPHRRKLDGSSLPRLRIHVGEPVIECRSPRIRYEAASEFRSREPEEPVLTAEAVQCVNAFSLEIDRKKGRPAEICSRMGRNLL